MTYSALRLPDWDVHRSEMSTISISINIWISCSRLHSLPSTLFLDARFSSHIIHISKSILCHLSCITRLVESRDLSPCPILTSPAARRDVTRQASRDPLWIQNLILQTEVVPTARERSMFGTLSHKWIQWPEHSHKPQHRARAGSSSAMPSSCCRSVGTYRTYSYLGQGTRIRMKIILQRQRRGMLSYNVSSLSSSWLRSS